MPITFERNICCNLDETASREWLITNGLGGYAAGNVAGMLTRMQQGLLVANLDEKTAPQLLVAKLDEEILFDQRTYYLGTNEYLDGTLNPAGFVHLESFRLEDGFPVFTYRLGGADGVLLEKRIWMPQGQNTTCIQYRALRTSTKHAHDPQATPFNAQRRDRQAQNGHHRPYASLEAEPLPLMLTLLPLVAYRPYNQPQSGRNDWQFEVQTHQQANGEHNEDADSFLALSRGVAGCTIRAWDKATPYHIMAVGHPESQMQFIPTGVWYWRFLRRLAQNNGQPVSDDLYLPGVIRAKLWPGQDATVTIIVTAEELRSQPLSQKQIRQSHEQAVTYQRSLFQTQSYFGEGGGAVQTFPTLPFADSPSSTIKGEEFLQLLYQAGDRLLIRRTLPYQEHSGESVLFFRAAEHIPLITPGYYQLDDNLRETLIALPGLLISTSRYSEAQRMLRHISRYFRQGLLPDRLPTTQQAKLTDADYTGVDTALWYFYALDKYLSATHDYDLLSELYLRLADSIVWYLKGTYHGIRVDPADGLLLIGTSERPATWMNATMDGKAVTPRVGKPVEINALWYHTLSLMHEWSQMLYQRGHINHTMQQYADQAEVCKRSFNQRFWYEEGNYLFDLVDGPQGDDRSLRPNQLLALSLRYAVLTNSRQASVLEVVTQQLLTDRGLRTLAVDDPAYQGQFPLQHAEFPAALHQGAIWPWLIGPYIDALLRVGMQLSTYGSDEVRQAGDSPSTYNECVWQKGIRILEPFRQYMQEDMLANISNVYAGDAPYQSGPQVVSAISIGEILRTYKMLARMGIHYSDEVVPA
jgi:glycogen debranching enzyme